MTTLDQPRQARRRRLLQVVAALAVAAMVIACRGGADDIGKLRQQAHAALDRWAAAVAAAGGAQAVVPVGELTSQVGDWEEANGDNKAALFAGMVEAGAELPSTTPPDADVTFQDGSTATVPLISAVQAVTAIQATGSAPCPECRAMRITGARLTTGPIATSRGPATAPLWEFTIEGTAVTVTRVAIANPITVVPPPWDSNTPPGGLRIDSAVASADRRELTVSFTGAPGTGDQPCGEDYTTEAVESDLAVVVIVIRHPHLTFGGCTAVGATRTATVSLAGAIGDRAVLEVQEGTPVPVTLAP